MICSKVLREQGKPYPRTCAVHGLECPECVEKQPDIEKQRDAWRAACRYLYEVIGEGGPKGRPIDLISKGDYGRIIAMIGKAESLEEDA